MHHPLLGTVWIQFPRATVIRLDGARVAADAIYINLGLVDLNEGSGLITIAVSGNRNCAGTCPTLILTLTALDTNVGQRRGAFPAAVVTPDPCSPTDGDSSLMMPRAIASTEAKHEQ
jgi:hypothetical protein